MDIDHPDARVEVTELKNGKRRIHIQSPRESVYIHRDTWDTAYPVDLIRLILEIKGPGYLCDEIARDEDPAYIKAHLQATLFAHLPRKAFEGKRLLDFGCGSGASTVILSQLLPETQITGVELEADFLRVARARAAFYGVHATFLQSPSGSALPKDLGTFDVIFLPAVFEHLLPGERRLLIPELWKHLTPGGTLFIDETPHRWFPVETHTSSLPLVNYLPAGLAAACVRTFSRRGLGKDTWDELLRKGVRGGSAHEILRIIRQGGGTPALLPPKYEGMRTPIDVWVEGYARHAMGRSGAAKRSLGSILKFIYATTHLSIPPYLSLAIKKNT